MDPLIETEKKYGSGLYSLRPFRIERGEGVYLYSNDGTKYLDFMSGHGVACLGHKNPSLVRAIKEQADKLITLHSSYPTEVRARFLEKMAEITPKPLSRTFMVNSGTEAVEGALKLALANRREVKNPNIVAMKRSFHGRTLGSLAMTFNPKYRRAFQETLNPYIRFASFNDIEDVKEKLDENTVAIITELVQGEGGVYPASPKFAKQLRELCTEKDILFIADEVQTGFGRCGEFFACDHYKVLPDILCTAKGTGGGFPMGTIVSTPEIFKMIKKGEHASTFGGNPLAAAAGLATIDYIQNNNVIGNVKAMSNILFERIGELPDEMIREVRGLGLLIGIQLRKRAGSYLRYCAMKRQVLFLPAGMTVLRMLPPLIITESNVDKAIDAVGTALMDVK